MKTFSKLFLLTGVASLAMASLPAQARDLGDGIFAKERFQIRARVIGVFADGDGIVENTTLETDADNAFTPEIDITYFFTQNFAAEIIAGTSHHNVTAGPNKLGDVWALPPTLTLQYHFTPDNKFSPYIGAGINYTIFYAEDTAAGFSDFDVGNGFGLAAQAGFDYWLNDHWGVNFDAKYIDVNVDASVNNGGLNAYDVDINPWVVGAGVSYRF